MVDTAGQIRRAALRDHATIDMELQDGRDVISGAVETPQEMHERMLAEDASEETLDLLEGLREMQGGELVTWKVWRIAGPNGEPLRSGPDEYCGHLGNSQLTMENIASLFGGGKYRVKGRFSDGKIAGGRTITIAADAKRQESSMAQVASGGNSFNMSEWLAMQQQSEERRRAEERERDDRSEKRWMALAQLGIPVLGSIVSAVISRPAQAAIAGPDPIAGMKAMAETLATLQGLTGGGDSGGDSLVEIIKAVAPHAGPALAALAARPSSMAVAPRRAARVAAPGTQANRPLVQPQTIQTPPMVANRQEQAVHNSVVEHTGVNLEAPSQPLSDQDRNMFAQLKPQVDALVTMAQQGADPIETANVFFDTVMINLEDTAYGTVANLFSDPNALTKIAIFNTGVKTYLPFFEGFQKRMIERIVAEDQEASKVI